MLNRGFCQDSRYLGLTSPNVWTGILQRRMFHDLPSRCFDRYDRAPEPDGVRVSPLPWL
jgi:hypothetical protein